MEERNSDYEIKISRNGFPIPVVHGIHLHSIFNPIKEAEAFAYNYQETIKTKSNFLFLGLGFCYHIEEIIKIAASHHQEIGILIVEPNTQIIEDYLNEFGAEKKAAIIHHNTIDEYFLDETLVDFLLLKPAIVKHDASFELNKDFFSKFLSFRPTQEICKYDQILECGEYKNYLTNYSSITFNQLVSNIKNSRRINNKNDFLTLAINEVAQG